MLLNELTPVALDVGVEMAKLPVQRALGRSLPLHQDPDGPPDQQDPRGQTVTAGLKAVASWVPRVDSQTASPFSSHRVLDARSLALHCLIAQKIMADPSLIDITHRNLAAWRKKASGAEPHYLAEWQRILARPWPQVAGLITEQSAKATRLRQSSPFAGVLSTVERRRIYSAFRT